MEKNCEYCGGLLSGSETSCPHCGAPISAAGGKNPRPRTLEELIAFARSHNLPLDKMRFFLGQDYPGPKAYGIFRDADGSFVVYKNKADGTRAIRYRGPDEAHAVEEIYLKMREEVSRQRGYQAAKRRGVRSAPAVGRAPARSRAGTVSKLLRWILVIAAVVLTAFFYFRRSGSRDGYYRYRGGYYYNQNDDWFYYSGTRWIPLLVDDELNDNAADYYADQDYRDSWDVRDFADSEFYDPPENDGWDWNDDDDDWDWGGGDGGDWDDIGDWDSDW